MLFLHSARDMVVRKRRWQCMECSNGIKHQGLNEQLCLRKERTLDRIFRKTIQLEVAKQIVGTFIRLRKINVRLCGEVSPSETKKETTNNSKRAIDVEAWSFYPHQLEEDDGDNLDRLAPYQGTTWDEHCLYCGI
jgi:hypothetical protein